MNTHSMFPYILPNRKIRRPIRAEDDGVLGDGWEDIAPGHPDYEALKAALDKEGNP
jgi:hypothetical protein